MTSTKARVPDVHFSRRPLVADTILLQKHQKKKKKVLTVCAATIFGDDIVL